MEEVLDKYERKVRVNQILSLTDREEFGEALEIADTIDWRTEKSVRTLRMVSEVYKINRRYGDAFNVLSIAYDRDPDDPIKRKIVYDLCEIAIKLDQYAYAIKYLKEFVRLSPNDPGKYILHYKILKATGAEYSEMIETLEEFKKNYFGDFLERWAYELAYLYYQTGQSQKCINACDEIILWFFKGPYVEKAKELKASFISEADLSQGPVNTGYAGQGQDPGMYGNDPYYGMNGYQDGGDAYAGGYDGQSYDPAMQQDTDPGMQQGVMQEQPRSEGMSIEVRNVYASNEPTIRMPDRQLEEQLAASSEPSQAPDEVYINVDKYSTINLQEELKANIDELEEKTGEVMTQPEQSIPEPEQNIPEPDVGMTEIFNEKDTYAEPGVEDLERAPEVRDVPVYRQERSSNTLYRTEETMKPTVIKKTEFGESLPRMPQQYRNLLNEGYDGQINMNVPDEPAQVEKQITGQMDLATVLAQWEEVRAQSKRRFETLTPMQVTRNESERAGKASPEGTSQPERAERTERPERPERPPRPERAEKREKRPEKEAPRRPEKKPVPKEEVREEKIVEKTDFTDEERQIFAPFISMGGMQDRLLKALSHVSMTGSRGNVVVAGNEETLRMAMAQSLARDQQQKNSYMGIKVAKIDADVFNTKDIERSLKALDGNVLVVEKAGRLSRQTMTKLTETLSSEGLSLLVILEDEKNALRTLPWDDEDFNRVFSVAIEIPTFSNNDLVQHAKDYARAQEYLIDEMAILALYSRIDEKQTAEHQVTAAEVEAIVDDAIRNVNKKNMSHLMDVLFAKRYNEDDLIIIREKDFEKK